MSIQTMGMQTYSEKLLVGIQLKSKHLLGLEIRTCIYGPLCGSAAYSFDDVHVVKQSFCICKCYAICFRHAHFSRTIPRAKNFLIAA